MLAGSDRAIVAWLAFCGLLSGIHPCHSSSSLSTSPCSICPNPRHSITLPNATFPLFGTCGAMETSVGFIAQDSDICRLIQSVSSLCGCPVSKSSCFLCNHNYHGAIDSARPVPYLLEATTGVNITCDIVQAYLHSIPAKNETCTLTKGLVGPYCGCPLLTGGSSSDASSSNISAPCSLCKSGQVAARPNRTVAIGLNLPFFRTCGDLENVAKTYWLDGSDTCGAVQSLGAYCGCPNTMTDLPPCTFCVDGSAATLVNQTLPFLKQEFNLAGIEPTCGLVDAAIQSIPATDPLCTSLQLLGSYCGCPAIQDHCVYCPKPGDHATTPNRVVRQFGLIAKGLDEATCEVLISTQYQVPSSSDTCWKAQSKNYLCGCNGGQFDYLGADTIAKKRALVWLPRISALLSVCGSVFILVHIYRYHRSPLDQYHELVACISSFNLVGSLAFMFTTLPIPPLDNFGEPSGIYGAHGNVATCKSQGFFIYLGYTGIFYNLSLSIYYVLVVNFGYRESDLKNVRKWFHLPALVGLTFAIAAIPYIDNFFFVCHIPSPPIIPSRYINAIALIPITISMALSAVGMFVVYVKVLRQTRASNQWRFGNGGGARGKLSRKVFWQAFFFVVALYGSWPIMVVAVFYGNNRRTFQIFWFWAIAVTLAPLQGFFNFFVYTRPQLIKYFKRRRRLRRQSGFHPRNSNWQRMGIRRSFFNANGYIFGAGVRFSEGDKSGPATNSTSNADAAPAKDDNPIHTGNDQLDADELGEVRQEFVDQGKSLQSQGQYSMAEDDRG